MATGIESIALRLTGHAVVSEMLMWLALAMWTGLGLLLLGRLTQHGAMLWTEARAPASLTGVAGTCVVGVRMTQQGWGAAGVLLLVMAALGCAGLQVSVWRHWRTPATAPAS
jgi:hypothetical protein